MTSNPGPDELATMRADRDDAWRKAGIACQRLDDIAAPLAELLHLLDAADDQPDADGGWLAVEVPTALHHELRHALGGDPDDDHPGEPGSFADHRDLLPGGDRG